MNKCSRGTNVSTRDRFCAAANSRTELSRGGDSTSPSDNSPPVNEQAKLAGSDPHQHDRQRHGQSVDPAHQPCTAVRDFLTCGSPGDRSRSPPGRLLGAIVRRPATSRHRPGCRPRGPPREQSRQAGRLVRQLPDPLRRFLQPVRVDVSALHGREFAQRVQQPVRHQSDLGCLPRTARASPSCGPRPSTALLDNALRAARCSGERTARSASRSRTFFNSACAVAQVVRGPVDVLLGVRRGPGRPRRTPGPPAAPLRRSRPRRRPARPRTGPARVAPAAPGRRSPASPAYESFIPGHFSSAVSALTIAADSLSSGCTFDHLLEFLDGRVLARRGPGSGTPAGSVRTPPWGWPSRTPPGPGVAPCSAGSVAGTGTSRSPSPTPGRPPGPRTARPAASLYLPWANRVSDRNSCRVASLGSSLIACLDLGLGLGVLAGLEQLAGVVEQAGGLLRSRRPARRPAAGVVGSGSPASRAAASGDGGYAAACCSWVGAGIGCE